MRSGCIKNLPKVFAQCRDPTAPSLSLKKKQRRTNGLCRLQLAVCATRVSFHTSVACHCLFWGTVLCRTDSFYGAMAECTMKTTDSPCIVAAERMGEGIFIEFDDGKAGFYSAPLPYSMLPLLVAPIVSAPDGEVETGDE